jgi:ATP:cob(I)alamin adenosyltransferase
MKIYTKTGDQGNTSLYDGSKVSKDHQLLECIGDLDELNSELGCVLTQLDTSYGPLVSLMSRTQSSLFDLGALIAHPNQPEKKKLRFDETGSLTRELEMSIDEMTTQLPKLTNFILPGGNITMSFIHKARTVCRRVERRMVALKTDYEIEPTCYVYMNRLSDFLFTLARYAGHLENVPEVIYIRTKPA